MKVKNLITQLQKLDQDAEIMISGYEGGYDYLSGVEEAKSLFNLNVHTAWYYREHDLAFGVCEDREQIEAYILS